MRRLLRLRRHELTVPVLLGARDIAGRGTLVRGGEQGLHVEDARNDHGRDIAAVHPGTLVANHFLVERRRVAVEVPALHPEAALQFLDDRGLGDECIFLGAAQSPSVHERQVRKITQVVDDQQIVCIVMQISGNALPFRILQVG